ncbi:MAG: histidine ammonia-lyase [Chloroflexota bacterium]|nr:histidine ammonia-lyase [Chloroflexota bacterium]MDQ5867314.1 histidine ammonia-lyase [Chloroflexota bacterium]
MQTDHQRPSEARTLYSFVSDGTNLTPSDVARIARSPRHPSRPGAAFAVGMSADAQERVARSRGIVDDIVRRGEVVYGITTGFGAFKDRVVSHEDLAQLQVNLILSQCVGVGNPLPAEVVRALMLCRAHTLSLGYSGIRLETLGLIYDMLNAGVHPLIPEQGSVGASGDLAPLSHMALGMLGLGQAEYGGRFMPAGEALAAAGLQHARLAPKEGLALSNGTSLMSALLSLALVDAALLCDTADVVGAMSLEAMQGVPYAFDPRIHAVRGHSGQMASAANIRRLTEASTLMWRDIPGDGLQKAAAGKVQDAYSLRCMPQVHGPARDAVGYVNGVLAVELNGANDNPLVFGADTFSEEHAAEVQHTGFSHRHQILSGGNFHGAPLSVASDFLAIAVCQLATISERRQARLVDPAAHGGLFPAFLIENGGLNSGFMMVQYTSAALASENKSLAHPASVDTIPTSANVEDHVSMGPIAARHARAIVANTARVLALEAMMAAQALDFRMRNEGTLSKMGRGTAQAYTLVRERVPFLSRDEDFQPYIAAVEDLVLSGKLASVLADVSSEPAVGI